tara:strand:- start:73 stop:426 length:354 start_codon:yes stop_codon:yes gene_type:complete
MLAGLLIVIIFLIIFIIRSAIFNATREKLLYEKEKKEFLNEKHKYLLDSTEENITDIYVHLPKYKTGNWKVVKKVKSGTWPFTDKEDYIDVMEISDENLTDLISESTVSSVKKTNGI